MDIASFTMPKYLFLLFLTYVKRYHPGMSHLPDYTLAIDASTDQTDMVITGASKVLARTTTPRLTRGESRLFNDIRNLIASAGITPPEISRYAAGLGPGSFSGIRSVLSALQAMALPGEKPVIGISSGAAMAEELRSLNKGDSVAVIGDARRNRLWIGRFIAGMAFSHTEADFLLIPRDNIRESLEGIETVGSPDWERLESELLEQIPDRCHLRRNLHPDAAVIAELAANTIPAKTATPIYMHPPVR